jgi:cytochrome c553
MALACLCTTARALTVGATWHYTTDDPGKDWATLDPQSCEGWKTGKGGFGKKGTPGGTINTEWRTSDIWMRAEFHLKKGTDVGKLSLEVCHDEAFEAYINGVLAASAKGVKKEYRIYAIRPEARKSLKVGKNAVAVHCRQTVGGQFIDVGFTDKKVPRPTPRRRRKPERIIPFMIAYARQATWPETMLKARLGARVIRKLTRKPVGKSIGTAYALEFWRDFPVQTDWFMQDSPARTRKWSGLCHDGRGDFTDYLRPDRDAALERELIAKVLPECDAKSAAFKSELDALTREGAPPEDPRWLGLYEKACVVRRAERLRPLLAKANRIIFAKHHTMGAGFFAYTEYTYWDGDKYGGLFSLDLANEATPDGRFAEATALIKTDAPGSIIRDPDISYDAKRVLFAWRRGPDDKFYKVHEMDLATGETRLVTGEGTYGASYDPCYLPDGNVMFASTRVVQSVDCAGPDVSNLFICDLQGRFARRVGFDQVHTLWPAVLDDGRVVYMRWDYNDRSQIYTQPLFQMNPDGTAQTEYYGNNTFEPTTFFHPRGIPGTTKVVCAIGGHHNPQRGKLAVIDPSKGRQGLDGVIEIPGGGKPPYKRADRYAQIGGQFAYPYALDDSSFLVSYDPLGYYLVGNNNGKSDMRFHLYYMAMGGEREVLAADSRISCFEPMPVIPRKVPHVRPSVVDHRKDTGTFFVQDVYAGPGLKGIPRGTIKKLRVVELKFREFRVGANRTSGKGGGATVVTPIATGTGAWDVKVILGDVPVHEDGSAMFEVPAKTPVYFQLLNDRNQVIQTMRSWSTLMPGETFSCVGCHENKNDTPLSARTPSLAMAGGARKPQAFYGPARGFSFPKEVQPILDRHCVKCHKADGKEGAKKFLLTDEPVLDKYSKRNWSRSYLTLTNTKSGATECEKARGESNEVVNWINNASEPTMIPPQYGGSTRSKLISMMEEGHVPAAGGKPRVSLSREGLDKVAAWIDLVVPFRGDYMEAGAWSEKEIQYARGRIKLSREMTEIDRKNVEAYIEHERARTAGQ